MRGEFGGKSGWVEEWVIKQMLMEMNFNESHNHQSSIFIKQELEYHQLARCDTISLASVYWRLVGLHPQG
jgi:hypothetical protein